MSPRARLVVSILGATSTLALVTWWQAHQPADDVVRAEFVTIAFAVANWVITGLSWLFGGRKTDKGTKQIFETLRGDIVKLSDTFMTAIGAAGDLIARVIGSLFRGLSRIFGPLLSWMSRMFDRFVAWLQRLFGPLIDLIKKVKFYLQKIYDKIVKPIVDAIEFFRAFLRFLSFFGLDWARKLDAELARLQDLITFPLEWLTDKVNELANWVNRIVTLDGLLQRVMLLRSLIRDVGATTNLWWNAQSRPLTPLEQARYNLQPTVVQPAAMLGQVRRHFRTGDADISPVLREAIADARIIARGGSGA